MSDDKMYDDRTWHLDKRFPVVVVGTLALQILAFVWFLSGLNAKVDSNEQAVIALTEKLEKWDAKFERIIKLETDVRYIGDSVRRLEQSLNANRYPVIPRLRDR